METPLIVTGSLILVIVLGAIVVGLIDHYRP